jgi:hypothetical protein
MSSAATAAQPSPKKTPPTPADIVRRIGDSNDAALRYVLTPDPQLSRLSRKVREALISDLPPVTAGALLGPAALARHLVASAASGRYRDLFALWDLFRARPEDCKPVLAERSRALEKGREALEKAVRLGLVGHAERVAEDVAVAQGLIWQWLREALLRDLEAVGSRPAVASALLLRDPAVPVPLPAAPDERWLAEAAAAHQATGRLAPPVDALLAAGVDRLPATVATLSLAFEHYPERVGLLLDRVDLDSGEVGPILAWARDHGFADRLHGRAEELLNKAAAEDRAGGLGLWYAWLERGIDLPLPEPLLTPTVDDLDLTRPETAVLMARLVDAGAALDPQARLDELARRNRQLAEKAYETFVCAGLAVSLPAALEANPIVKAGTRCEYCRAWTWVRPGHERRCPRRGAALGAAPGAAATSPEEPAAGPAAADGGDVPPAPDTAPDTARGPAGAPAASDDPMAAWQAELDNAGE